MTEAGETRRIALADGSAATLGPGSALRLGFSALARNVELLAGMAFFEVSPDASRPFRVMTEKLVATALGTAFEVGNDAGYLTVTVDHGLVGVDLGAAAGTSRATQLGPGEWLTFDASLRTLERGSKEKAQIAAWRDGWIFADGETVSALVARISRWRQGKVLVADSSFGGERVSGAFDLADPQAALEAVVSPFGGVVRMLSPYLTVISRF
jgi:transmembrane sensor